MRREEEVGERVGLRETTAVVPDHTMRVIADIWSNLHPMPPY